MKRTILIFMAALAVLFGGLGYWGLFTEQGQRKYDEMDGLIPFAELFFAAILLCIAGIMMIVGRRKQ